MLNATSYLCCESTFASQGWTQRASPGTWGLILNDSSSHFLNGGWQRLLPACCNATSCSVQSGAELGTVSPGRDWGAPVQSLHAAGISPTCRRTGSPSPCVLTPSARHDGRGDSHRGQLQSH